MIAKLLLAVPTTVALASSGTAHASASQVNFGFVPFSEDMTYEGATLSSSTSITFVDPTVFITNTVQESGPFTDDSGAFVGMVVECSKDDFNNVTFEGRLGHIAAKKNLT